MMILHDAGIDQGGFGAAEGVSQQLPVLREAAGFGMMMFFVTTATAKCNRLLLDSNRL